MTDAYLKWANRNTRGHDDIIPAEDYEASWADGLCFCALYYAYFPEKIPIKTLKADTDADKIKNLELAFKVGEEAGIDRLLDPEDTMMVHEKKSIMLYISEMYGVLKDLPTKYQASAEWNKKFDADEKQRKFAEWKLKKEVESRGEIYIPAARTTSSRAVLNKQPSGNTDPPKKEELLTPAQAPSKARLSSQKSPAPAPVPVSEPEPVRSETPAMNPIDQVGLYYDISGRGKEGGNEGRMCIFTVTLMLNGKPVPNPVKEDLKVYMDCPGGPPRLNIMGGAGGAYHVGFTPSEGGQYWCDFVWRGHWCKEPYMLPVKNKLNKIPDHTYTGPERKAAGVPVTSAPPVKASPIVNDSVSNRRSSRADVPRPKEPSSQHSICSGRTCEMTDEECGTFNITCKDDSGDILKGDFNFDININGPSPVEHKLVNNGDGTFKCSFGPASAGEYTLEVSYKGKQLNHGTWEVNVLEAIGGIEFEDITILFHATQRGKLKTFGGDLEHFSIQATGDAQPEIYDLEDGRYTLDYHVIPGVNCIDVRTQEKSLGGFPLTWSI